MSLIINGQTLANCTCNGIKSPHPMCDGEFRVDDKGVKAKLEPNRDDEDVQLIIFDDCICTRNVKKCDALYLYRNNSKKIIVSVELKGSHIDDGIEQLIETEKTPEYINIRRDFNSISPNVRIAEKKVLVSSTLVDALAWAKYCKSYDRSIIFIYYNINTRIPEIRDYLSNNR